MTRSGRGSHKSSAGSLAVGGVVCLPSLLVGGPGFGVRSLGPGFGRAARDHGGSVCKALSRTVCSSQSNDRALAGASTILRVKEEASAIWDRGGRDPFRFEASEE